MHRIALIIVNWNSWDMLSRCLEALDAQTFRAFSVIVVDNASDDAPPLELVSRHPDVRLVKNASNLGFAAANNRGLDLIGDKEWIATLNPDAFPSPDWLERLMEAVRANPGYAMYASRQMMDSDHGLLDGDGDAYHLSGMVWREGHGLPASGMKQREVFSPCAAAALYRRDALLDAGGFDEDFFCYVEDVDLGFRMRLAGHRCLLVPSAVVYHIGSATTGGQRSDFSVYHGHRNMVWCFVKNMPGLLFWALLPLHFAANAAAVIVYALRGQGRIILKAKFDALSGLPAMWKKRRAIQKIRRVGIAPIWHMLNKDMLPGSRKT